VCFDLTELYVPGVSLDPPRVGLAGFAISGTPHIISDLQSMLTMVFIMQHSGNFIAFPMVMKTHLARLFSSI
jgi:hypothetical protein